ncbi:hypothetical protein MRX96_026684 [Rhipicephalus microplus]
MPAAVLTTPPIMAAMSLVRVNYSLDLDNDLLFLVHKTWASPYSWLVVPAACVFVTTLAVALVAFLTLGSSSSHDYDDDTFGDGNGPSGNVLYTQTTTTGKTSAYESTPSPATPSQAPSQSQPVTVPTMPLTMTTHILASTLAPTTTSTTAATIGPPTTTTQVPLPPGSLVCTIGQGFDKSTYTFPPDGLCTIIIFDSLYRNNASLAPPYPNDFAYFLETARQAERTEFGIGIHQENEVTLDIFIAMAYFRLPNINFRDCIMVAPTFLPRALSPELLKNAYMYNVACLQPPYNASFYLDTNFEALVAFNVQEGFIFTYDTPANLRTKLCNGKKLATNVTNHMAAVDIQFEDHNNTCGHGTFPRLVMLKQLSLFFSTRYTSPDKEAECLAF